MGMGRETSSAQVSNKQRGASFVDKLFTPFSGKMRDPNTPCKPYLVRDGIRRYVVFCAIGEDGYLGAVQ